MREALPRVVAMVNDSFTIESRLVRARSPEDLALLADAHRHFGETLLALFEFALYERMLEEFRWYVSSLSSRGFDRAYFARLINAYIIAVNSAVGSSEAREITRPLEWLARNSDSLFEPAGGGPAPLADDARAFLELALAGKRREAYEHVAGLRERGYGIERTYTEIVLPALAHVGRRWEANLISVSEEHAATEICRYVLMRLADEMPRAGRLGLTALVGCVPGEQHDMGAQLTAGYLEAMGWDVIYLGRSAPEADVVRMVAGRAPRVCIFSASMIARLPAARDLFVKLREAAPRAGIIAGGRAALLAAEALAPFADTVVSGVEEAHQAALRLAGGHA